MQTPHITIEQASVLCTNVEAMLKLSNELIDKHNAKAERELLVPYIKANRSITLVNDREPDVKPALSLIEQPLITAEEARKLGPGNAMYLLINTWIPCTGGLYDTHYFGGEKIKYRAIKQPESVEPINHIELLGEIYGFLQSICPKGIADEAFRIVPEAIRAQAIAKYAEPSDAIRECVRHTQEAGRAQVTSSAHLT